jgi:hypothetical protein
VETTNSIQAIRRSFFMLSSLVFFAPWESVEYRIPQGPESGNMRRDDPCGRKKKPPPALSPAEV